MFGDNGNHTKEEIISSLKDLMLLQLNDIYIDDIPHKWYTTVHIDNKYEINVSLQRPKYSTKTSSYRGFL